MQRVQLILAGALLGGALVAGCRGETSHSAPIVPLRNMHDQHRYDPQQESQFFRDGMTMRAPVAGTFARDMEPELTLSEGRTNDDSDYVSVIPESVIDGFGGGEATVARGQERYNVYCRPCHDGTGTGLGTVVERGMAQPPSLHEGRLRQMPDGQLFATISNGIRNMPPYQHSILAADRWAIVAYVRALQLSEANTGE